MGSEIKYEIGQNAYVKLVLHVLKYRGSAVNGILIGRFSGNVVHITDSVPLFHSQMDVLPSMDLGLITIEDYCDHNELDIVGYFHANERFDDLELGSFAKSMGDYISQFFPQSALFLLDNKKLGAVRHGKDMSPVMQLYTRDASESWKLVVDESYRLNLKEPSANIALINYVSSGKWKDIIDMDDHLDDSSKLKAKSSKAEQVQRARTLSD